MVAQEFFIGQGPREVSVIQACMDHKIRCEALARDLLSVASFGRNLQARSRVRSLERADVRLWHLADIDTALENVRFRGQSGHHHAGAVAGALGCVCDGGVQKKRLIYGLTTIQ